MSLHWRRMAMPVLVLGLLLTSCESPSGPEIPREQTTPEAGLWDWFFGDDDDDYEDGTVVGLDGREYQLVEGDVPGRTRDRTEIALIGSDGGSLELLGHSLTVPVGAVLENTIFTITAIDEGYVEVRLEANIIRRLLWFLGQVIEYVLSVGENGFNEPIILELSYASADGVNDPEDLHIARWVDDERVQVLDVEIDRDEQVIRAYLDHFSRYCMVTN